MSLGFLSDQCVPGEIVDYLRQGGHGVTLLREVLPIRAPDSAVIEKARELGVILLSLNGDFADIVAYPPAATLELWQSNCITTPRSFPNSWGDC